MYIYKCPCISFLLSEPLDIPGDFFFSFCAVSLCAPQAGTARLGRAVTKAWR
jgi:hypothetical protein